MLKWDEKYAIGVETIDNQHKHLFSIAQNIYDLLKNDFKSDKFDSVVAHIEELKDYTVFHFKTGEDYMQKIGYKKCFTHAIEHIEFIKKVNSIDFDKIDENQDEFIFNLLDFLTNWLADHILEKDKLYTQL